MHQASRSVPLLPLLLFLSLPCAADQAPDYPSHADLSYSLDAAGMQRPIKTPNDWLRRRRHVLEGFQLVAGQLPPRTDLPPLDVRVDEEVTLDDQLIRRRISFQSSTNHRVAAYLFLPVRKNDEKLPAVLCLHPTGTRGKEIVSLPDVKQNRAYAFELARRGYVTLAPDYPTFGDYQIDFARNNDFESGTIRAVWDNMRAVDLLQSLPEVDGERIAAIGHSLGGHNAIFTAVFDERIKAVVSSCGFTRFHKYYNGNLKGWTSARYMPRIATTYHNKPDEVPFDFPELIASLAPRPFFTNSPLRDDNFDVSGVKDSIASARPIYALLGTPQNLVAVYPDAAHDFPDDVREQAYEFLDRHLRAAPKK